MELLGRIAACCAKPADRAIFRTVCRSWLSAARHHCPPASLLPWAVLPDGSFLMLSDGGRDWPSAVLDHGGLVKPPHGPHSLALPENTTCVGSTGSWLALRRREPSSRNGEKEDSSSFVLHNPFSGTTVPLPDVDAVGMTKAPPGPLDPHKVLMRSPTAEDIVAVLTDSRSYPFVLTLPGKGAWTPEPFAPPFMYIIDVARQALRDHQG
nr:unnamed protein product [Digitaria exilis]